MTISTTENRYQYTGDGTTKAFSFPRYFEESSHLQVYVGSTLKTNGSDYAVTGAGEDAGGTVTFATAPGSGVAVTINRAEPYTQTVTSATLAQYKPETIEAGLTRRARAEQRLAEVLSRIPTLAPESALTGLAFPAPEASKAIRWNSSADGLEAYDPGSTSLAVPADASVTPAKVDFQATSYDPDLSFATAGTSSFAFATRTGRYVKLGDLVFVSVTVVFTPTIGTGSGNLQVSVPFAAATGVAGPLTLASISSNFATWGSSNTAASAMVQAGNSFVLIRVSKAGGSTDNIDAADMTSGAAHTLIFSGWYLTE